MKIKPSSKIGFNTTKPTHSKLKKEKNIDEYNHKSSQRQNIPTEQTEINVTSELAASTLYVKSSGDPTLCWNREIDNVKSNPVPLHIREKISPKAIIEGLRTSRKQTRIFESFNGFEPGAKYRYYDHRSKGNWQNRLIRGDSARVLSALASEDLEGEIQTIFFDPPYGIDFNSNFTPSLTRSSRSHLNKIKPGMELPKDPVSVKAFCDTWERKIDSYLDAMYRRLILMRNLLSNSGSIFVQIGSVNVHRMALLLDEIFGSDNKLPMITVATSASTSSDYLPEGSLYLLWYAKDKSRLKYRQLYELLNREEKIDLMSSFALIEDSSGFRKLNADDRASPSNLKHTRIFKGAGLLSQGESSTGRSENYVWGGTVYECPIGRHWSISKDGLDNLAKLNRLANVGKILVWKQYEDEIPGKKINNRWFTPSRTQNKRYPVQTSEMIIERCILMTSDPGDLILDPTGGSGTTAAIAEKYGRRWVVIDSSPVSIATIRHYISTKIYDWYLLQDSAEGAQKEKELGGNPLVSPYKNDPSLGFVYNRVCTVSPKILGYGKTALPTLLYNNPIKASNTLRVAGPFTVESETSSYILSSLSTDDLAEINSIFAARVLDCMGNQGIQHIHSSQKIIVRDIKPVSTFDGFTHTGIRDDTSETVAILVAPDIAPADNKFVNNAIVSTKKHNIKTLIVAAFEFQPLAIKPIQNGINVIKVSINRALQQKELDVSKIDRALVMIGDPRVSIQQDNSQYVVEVLGYDVFDPVTGNLIPGDEQDVDCWMIDTDYNDKSFFAREIHYPNATSSWSKSQMNNITKMLGNDLDRTRWEQFNSLKSAPFVSKTGNIAIKIITMTGDEMMVQGSLKQLIKQTSST